MAKWILRILLAVNRCSGMQGKKMPDTDLAREIQHTGEMNAVEY